MKAIPRNSGPEQSSLIRQPKQIETTAKQFKIAQIFLSSDLFLGIVIVVAHDSMIQTIA